MEALSSKNEGMTEMCYSLLIPDIPNITKLASEENQNNLSKGMATLQSQSNFLEKKVHY